MKTYLAYFKLRFITSLQYRSAALAGMSTQIFFGLISIFLYQALYNYGVSQTISLSKTINYLWLNQGFLALINQMTVDSEITDIIIKGDLSYELIRPKETYFMWFAKTIAQRLSAVLLRSIPLFIFAVLLLPNEYQLTGPENILYFILFIISLTLGSILVTSLSLFAPIICMKTLNDKGFVAIYKVISNLLSGIEIPTYFFPKIIKSISNLLPFQYVSDFPFQLYNGLLSYNKAFFGILIQIFWIIITITLGYLLTRKFLRKAIIQGG